MVGINKIGLRDAPGVASVIPVGLKNAPGITPTTSISAKIPIIQQPNKSVISPELTKQPKTQTDIEIMQQKLVELYEAFKNNIRLKTILDLDDNDIAAIGFVGNAQDHNKEDGIWAHNTNTSATQAVIIAKQMVNVASEHNIILPFDANTVSGLGTALATKSAKTISDFIDKMQAAIPELSNAISKPGKSISPNELSDIEKFRLVELSNEIVANISLRNGNSIQVLFSDIASQSAFQQFIEKNKITKPAVLLKLINNQIQKQSGIKPTAKPQTI